MACLHFFCLTAAAQVVLLTLYFVLVLICVAATAAPIFSASSTAQQHRDKRVGQLRAALLDNSAYHVEALPDPPLEWGIHTACKKFGRGCPDTYVQFLEEFLISLKGKDADGDDRDVAGMVDETRKGTENATCQAPNELDNNSVPQVVAAAKASERCVNSVEDGAADTSLSLVSLLLCDLRLPLQLSWTYEARMRLENLLYLLATRESELRRDGVALASLQRLYHIPSADHIHLVEDVDGVITARLRTACAIGSASSSEPLPVGWTQQKWEDVYGAWCRHVEQHHQHPREDTLSAGSVMEARLYSLVPLPRNVWRCAVLHYAALYLQLLVRADQLLTWAWSWTLYTALPSACVACVLLWLCVGDAWSGDAESFVANASVFTENAYEQGSDAMETVSASRGTAPCAAPHQCHTSSAITGSSSTSITSSPVCEAEAAQSKPRVASVALTEGGRDTPLTHYDAVPASVHRHNEHQRQLQGQKQRRAAVLRCRLAASVLHRSPTLFFLKLRLLLCLLVAGQLLWSLWRVVVVSCDVTASAAPLVQFFLPSWLLACMSAYLVVPLQMMVLGTALKGALSAHEELLSFQAKCAAEQRSLLNAAGVLPLRD
ncbi:hypothetical protein, conserved [Leishmania tarentolae]|uniref:Uncharacterized protein n=1 Tax=Leishmania tarentolae TaxID=5689 RepID=A0A640KL04_LEITA|nr:hypothetical protein, conserved [Leishmania tarentolae]